MTAALLLRRSQIPLFLQSVLLLMLLFHPSTLQQQLAAAAEEEDHQYPSLSPLDLAALLTIKDTLVDLPGTRFLSTWELTPDPCSSFAGITCSPSPLSPSLLRITTLSLGTGLADSPGLAGTLSPSISNLTQLTQLILYPGFVTGPLPPELGLLTNLRVLSLAHNRLTGPIPDTLTALRSLHTLDLSFNQLTGSVPPSLSDLTQLKVLVLAANRLSGEVPDPPPGLFHMDLKQNALVGTLPSSLPPTLRYLSLSGNAMWGPLDGLASLSVLVYLDLGANRFGGPIPPSLLRPSLPSLLLQRNNFTGGIPVPQGGGPEPDDEMYGEGSVVDLSHNYLAGELPEFLACVEQLYLNNNRLSGTVPEEYVRSVREGRTKTLYLQHNFFSGFPIRKEAALPDGVDVCLSYNCMVPPVGLATCPVSAGGKLSRPAVQCAVFRNGGEDLD